jgi:hypothetical protein
MCTQILVKLSSATFHENPFSHFRVTRGETDEQTGTTEKRLAFLQLLVTKALSSYTVYRKV